MINVLKAQNYCINLEFTQNHSLWESKVFKGRENNKMLLHLRH